MTTTRPNTGTAPLTWRQRLHALTAAAALLALVAGVPLLLAAAVGNPLPNHLPTLTGAHEALTRPLSDTAVVRVLAGCAWLAWAHLLVSVLVETVTQLRGLPAPRRLPLLGVNQALAHRLVATALLVVPAAASTTAPVAALTRAPGVPYPASAPAAVAVTAAQVASSSPDVGTANDAACTVASTPVAAAPAAARAAHKVYVVQPPHGRHYDSLWDIAERHLGDGRRYHEIYQLNRGRPQPDGGELTRASLIQPGWVLLLPPDATGPGVLDETTDTPPNPAAQQEHPPEPAPADPAAPPSTAPVAPPKPRTPAGGAMPGTVSLPSPSPSPSPSASAATPPPAAPRAEQHRPPVAPIAVGLGVGSLAALAALRRARRIAQRRRPLGMRPAPVPTELRPVEAGLHAEARHVEPVTGAVRLAVALAEQRHHDMPIRAVLHHDGGDVDLLLDNPPTAPAPFHPIDGGWRLPADAAGFAFAVDAHGDPAPALLQLGRTGDADVYIDLEPLGAVAVDGDENAVDDWLATTVSRLVGAPLGRPRARHDTRPCRPPHRSTRPPRGRA